jgi:DNA repair protein RadC
MRAPSRAARCPSTASTSLTTLVDQLVTGSVNPWSALDAACRSGDASALRLAELVARLARTPRNTGQQVTTPASLLGLLPGAAMLDREHFWLIGLSAKHRVIRVLELARGTDSAVTVDARQLFREALLMDAAAFIVAHNHPSGDPSPSEDDRALTAAISDGARRLGLRFLDHIIVGASGLYSFASEGTL